MKIRTLCIIAKMLREYVDILENAEIEVVSTWMYFFTKEELLEMLLLCEGEKFAELYSRESTITYEELITLVQDESVVVRYIANKIEELLNSKYFSVDVHLKSCVINQLEMEDSQNETIQLLRRAGYLQKTITGINSADKAFPISVHYSSLSEAQSIMGQLIAENQVLESDVEIKLSEVFLNPLVL